MFYQWQWQLQWMIQSKNKWRFLLYIYIPRCIPIPPSLYYTLYYTTPDLRPSRLNYATPLKSFGREDCEWNAKSSSCDCWSCVAEIPTGEQEVCPFISNWIKFGTFFIPPPWLLLLLAFASDWRFAICFNFLVAPVAPYLFLLRWWECGVFDFESHALPPVALRWISILGVELISCWLIVFFVSDGGMSGTVSWCFVCKSINCCMVDRRDGQGRYFWMEGSGLVPSVLNSASASFSSPTSFSLGLSNAWKGGHWLLMLVGCWGGLLVMFDVRLSDVRCRWEKRCCCDRSSEFVGGIIINNFVEREKNYSLVGGTTMEMENLFFQILLHGSSSCRHNI